MRKKNAVLDAIALIGKILICVICAVIVFVVVLNVLNKIHYSIVVFNVSGKATVDRNNKNLSAVKGMHLKSEDKVSVLDDSWTRLCLDDSKYTYLGSGAVVSIEHPAISKKRLTMNVEKGQVILEIRKKLKDNQTFDVVTPNANMGIRGTVIAVRCEQTETGNTETFAYVLEGKGVLECSYIDENGNIEINEISLSAGEGWKFETDKNNKLTETGLGEPCDAGEFDLDDIDVHTLQGADNNNLILNIDGVREEFFSETADYITLFGKQYKYEKVYDISLLYDVYTSHDGWLSEYLGSKVHDVYAIIHNAILRLMFRMFGGR